MTGVTHGADAVRLRDIATTMRGQGQRVQDIGDELVPLAAMLQEAWGGPDAEHLLTQVEGLRPSIAGTGATLVAWAEELRGQADEQAAGSGESGGAGGPGGQGGGGANPFAGLRAQGGAPTGGNPLLGGAGNPLRGEGGVPLTNAFTREAGGGKEEPPQAIGEGSQVDRGRNIQPGFTTNTDTPGSDKPGLKVRMTGTETVETSPEFVDSEGRSVQTSTLTVRVEAGLVGEAGGKTTGGGFSGTGGTEVSYSVTAPVGVDPATIDPTDPASWPPGTSVRLNEDYFVALQGDVRFRGLLASAGIESGSGAFVEVSKGDGDEVTVLVGDSEFSRASTSLGIGSTEANAQVTASSGVTTGTAKEVTLDLSTPAGQEAYRGILEDGSIPAADSAGVVDVADVTVLNASRSLGASGTLGDITMGGTLSSWEVGGVQRTHADGSTTLEWSGQSAGTQVGGVATFDPDGNMIVEDNTYYMRMEGVDPATAGNYNRNYLDRDVSPTTEQNVVLTLTHDDLTAMRSQAAVTQANMINANPQDYPDFPIPADGSVSATDVLRHCEDNPDAVFELGGADSATQLILGAQSDQEILRGMMAKDPLLYQQELATDYYTYNDRERVRPVGEITSQRSSG